MFGVRKRLIFISLIIQIAHLAVAQKERAVWYFGNGIGLDFNHDPPSVLEGGRIGSPESCASICDDTGTLLFYSNGVSVWNRDHEVMENGEGLMGNQSTSQSLILRQPWSNHLYYIFTPDDVMELQGITWSLVDMRLNEGKGAVVQKNNFLYGPSTERIVPVKHNNNIDTWIITHGWLNNTFYAHLLTSDGILPDPVLSHSGIIIGSDDPDQTRGPAIGYLKASPNGEKIAITSFSALEIFDFDNATGILSNPKTLEFRNEFLYGLAFSPDGSKLYVSSWTGRLYQLDLSHSELKDIRSSITLLASQEAAFGALQTAINKKIYFSNGHNRTHLGVINHPDLNAENCGMEIEGLFLNGNRTSVGLPFSDADGFEPNFSYDNTCVGESIKFSVPFSDEIDSAFWDFNDPGSGTENLSKIKEPTHHFINTGIYHVSAIFYRQGEAYRLEKRVEILPSIPISLSLQETIVICSGDSVYLDIFNPGATYKWSNGSTEASQWVRSAGLYVVEVTNGCLTEKDSVEIFTTEPFEISLGEDTVLCGKESLILSAYYPKAHYRWQDGSMDSLYVVTEPGLISVEVENVCVARDTINVTFKDCDIFVPNVFTPNQDEYNEYFIIKGIRHQRWHLSIYNRWGKKVYKNNNYKNDWNGDSLETGIYFYYLSDQEGVEKNGIVTILR
ncbi:gliding motility-associated C-terminal domain-containing protein [Fulvivirgaceae bacterium BMA10]|uniref:Gliding motility-associated C-terminal domain-containing protein n=1 Tax=Splendidivirga corallicola TaxID=3051826 RepID=A0ABT8KIF7_9BACT|nr:gliding motility-associated C-terminal domain-containing protein [Fulvivirgaceae bacterium BMA10]